MLQRAHQKSLQSYTAFPVVKVPKVCPKIRILQPQRVRTRGSNVTEPSSILSVPQTTSKEASALGQSNLVPAFLLILEGSFLAGALCLQFCLLRSARASQQVLGRAETSLILLSLAAALRFVYRFWTDGRRDPTSILGGAVTASGTVRLHRLEILHTRQQTALSNFEKELSKSRLRLHTVSKDTQPALRQVQAESAVHADGLVSISKKLEGLGRDIEDTRDLLAELQGASMKQLQLVVQAVKLAQAASNPDVQGNQSSTVQ